MKLKYVLPLLTTANEIAELTVPVVNFRDEHFYGPSRLYSMARRGYDISQLKRIPVTSIKARGFSASAELWSQVDDDNMITIPWTFDRNWPDSLPCNRFGVTDPKAAVREALAGMNRDMGCFKMVELSGEDELSTTKFENGIVFIYQPEPYESSSDCSGGKYGKKCFSAVGRAPTFNQLTDQIYNPLSEAAPGLKSTWQSIGMANDCFASGTIEHEVLHAMGVLHEHQSPDSDTYIMVDRTEEPLTPQDDWLDVYPYEMRSVMHYGSRVLAGPLSLPEGGNVAALRSNYANADGSIIWPSNFKTTTTDMLEVQQMCINRDSNFHKKETVSCNTADQFGFVRPVFTDRLCDGHKDCDDGSDEGDIEECAVLGGRTTAGCCSAYKVDGSNQWAYNFVWDKASGTWLGQDSHFIGKLPDFYSQPPNQWTAGWYIGTNQGYYTTSLTLDDNGCPAENGYFSCVHDGLLNPQSTIDQTENANAISGTNNGETDSGNSDSSSNGSTDSENTGSGNTDSENTNGGTDGNSGDSNNDNTDNSNTNSGSTGSDDSEDDGDNSGSNTDNGNTNSDNTDSGNNGDDDSANGNNNESDDLPVSDIGKVVRCNAADDTIELEAHIHKDDVFAKPDGFQLEGDWYKTTFVRSDLTASRSGDELLLTKSVVVVGKSYAVGDFTVKTRVDHEVIFTCRYSLGDQILNDGFSVEGSDIELDADNQGFLKYNIVLSNTDWVRNNSYKKFIH